MTNEVSKEFLQDHFRKHDSITLYKPDGTPVTISKKHNIILEGGHHRYTFKDCGELTDFFTKHHFCLKPIITVS